MFSFFVVRFHFSFFSFLFLKDAKFFFEMNILFAESFVKIFVEIKSLL